MLLLRFRTLEPVVDGFLVTEATTTHTNEERKPAVLTNALARSSNSSTRAGRLLTSAIRSKVQVRVIEFAKERKRFCPVPTMRCYEALQRFVLLEMLFDVASKGDLALVGDTDEFARPSIVSALKTCYPFDDAKQLPEYIVLKLTLFKFGVHCNHGNTFELGSRVFSVTQLLRSYGGYRTASVFQLAGMSAAFTYTRSRTWNAPSIPHAGWHLTSFGSSFELARKLRTFLHSNLFAPRSFVSKGSLDEPRLERCMRYCLELDKPKDASGNLPPCNARDDPRSRKLPGEMLREFPASELPRDLAHHRDLYPQGWVRFVPPTRTGVPDAAAAAVASAAASAVAAAAAAGQASSALPRRARAGKER